MGGRRVVAVVITTVALAAAPALAQESSAQQTYGFGADPGSTTSDSGNFFYGGYVGLAYGCIQYVEVSPIAGYRFSENFGAGLGLLYRYRKDTRPGNDVTSTDYGGNVFARYHLFSGLFTQAEYDYTSYEYTADAETGNRGRGSQESFLLGAGYSTAIGHGTGLYLAVLYDFNYSASDPYRLYNSPLQFRIGVSVGF